MSLDSAFAQYQGDLLAVADAAEFDAAALVALGPASADAMVPFLVDTMPTVTDHYRTYAWDTSDLYMRSVETEVLGAPRSRRPAYQPVPVAGQAAAAGYMVKSYAPVARQQGVELAKVLAPFIARRVASYVVQATMDYAFALSPEVPTNWRRVPRNGACAFCVYLSQFDHWSSEEHATVTAGWWQVKRNRSGHEKKYFRGPKQGLGEAFHDNCRCVAVPDTVDGLDALPRRVRARLDRYQEMSWEADQKVREARDLAMAGGAAPAGVPSQVLEKTASRKGRGRFALTYEEATLATMRQRFNLK